MQMAKTGLAQNSVGISPVCIFTINGQFLMYFNSLVLHLNVERLVASEMGKNAFQQKKTRKRFQNWLHIVVFFYTS